MQEQGRDGKKRTIRISLDVRKSAFRPVRGMAEADSLMPPVCAYDTKLCDTAPLPSSYAGASSSSCSLATSAHSGLGHTRDVPSMTVFVWHLRQSSLSPAPITTEGGWWWWGFCGRIRMLQTHTACMALPVNRHTQCAQRIAIDIVVITAIFVIQIARHVKLGSRPRADECAGPSES